MDDPSASEYLEPSFQFPQLLAASTPNAFTPAASSPAASIQRALSPLVPGTFSAPAPPRQNQNSGDGIAELLRLGEEANPEDLSPFLARRGS